MRPSRLDSLCGMIYAPRTIMFLMAPFSRHAISVTVGKSVKRRQNTTTGARSSYISFTTRLTIGGQTDSDGVSLAWGGFFDLYWYRTSPCAEIPGWSIDILIWQLSATACSLVDVMCVVVNVVAARSSTVLPNMPLGDHLRVCAAYHVVVQGFRSKA